MQKLIWGEENLDSICWWWQTETGGIMIANYPSMKVKPGSMGKPCLGEIAIAEVNGKQLKIITEPNVQGQLVLKRLSFLISLICMRRNDKKCFIGEWYLSDLAKRCRRLFWFIGRADDIIKTSTHGGTL
jgi:acetyl-CoA synthetase